MNLKERIKKAQDQRAAKFVELEKLVEKTGGDSPRVFTAEEKASFDSLSAEVKAFDEQLAQFADMERMSASAAQPIVDAPIQIPAQPARSVPAGSGVLRPNSNLPKGIAAAREVIAIIRAQGNVVEAARIAKGLWGDSTPEVAKKFEMRAAVVAATTTDAAWAGNLIVPDTSSEIVALINEELIIDKMSGIRKVPFNFRFITETQGVSAGWVGQGLSKPVGQAGYGTGTFPFAKVAVIVVFTDEILKFTSLPIETMVRDTIVRGTADFLNNQFVDSIIAPVANVKPGSITNAIVPTASASADSSPTIAEVNTDLSAALGKFAAANLTPRNPYWIVSPRTFATLSMLRTAQDVFAFREEMTAVQPRLLGIPVIVSGAVNTNLAPGTATEIILVDANEIFLADDGAMTFDMSREASLQMDSAPATPPTPLVSLWQQNLVGMKGERYIYWQRRREAAVAVVNAVLY